MRPSFENVSLLNGSPTLVRPALPSCGLNSDVFRSAIAFAIAALRAGVSSRSPCRRREDDVEHGALLGGELRLDQVGRLLRVGAGDRELVPQRAADRGDEDDQGRDDPDPGEDDAPGVAGAHAHPARERARRQPLVRRQALRRPVLLVLRHPLLLLDSVVRTNATRAGRGGADQDDPPRVACAHAHPARERPGRQPFVRRQALRRPVFPVLRHPFSSSPLRFGQTLHGSGAAAQYG